MASRSILLGAVILVTAGCGTPAPKTTSASPAPATTIAVSVHGGKVRAPGKRITVRRGRTVEIDVTSDAADEFHLHGYDREIELKPGVPGVLRFVADEPGVFEAELHRSGARAFELRVN